MQNGNITLSFFAKALLVFLLLFLYVSLATSAMSDAENSTQNDRLASNPPQRIVVFPLFAEEMLLEMIGPERIIGIGHEYVENGEGHSPTMQLTKGIADGLSISYPEDILALKPDLVVLWQDWSWSSDYFEVLLPALENAEVPILFLAVPQDFECIKDTLILLGDVVNAPEKAAEMVRRMDISLAKLSEIVSTIPKEKRIKVAYYDDSVDRPRIFHTIAHAAGVINASGSSHVAVDDQQLIHWNPDLILISPVVYDTDGSILDTRKEVIEADINAILSTPELSNVSAVLTNNIHPFTMSPSHFMVQSAIELAKLSYPELFPSSED